jgi:hypothetical protein
MAIQLDKELEKISTRDNKLNEPLTEVKLLLEGDRQKDLHIMRHLAGSSEMIQNEHALGRKLELINLEEKYGQIFTATNIRDLAVKYKLRLLNSTKFKGKMDIQAISKLKTFAEDSGLSIMDEATLSRRFYILAPVESFSTGHRTIKSAKDEEAERKRIARDPILFYKIDETHYRMIHKWGNDFSATRRILGWYWESPENYVMGNRMMAAVTSILVYALLWQWFNTFSFHIGSCFHFGDCKTLDIATAHHLFLFRIWGIIFAITAGIIQSSIMWSNVTNSDGKFYNQLFSKFNWNDDTCWTIK